MPVAITQHLRFADSVSNFVRKRNTPPRTEQPYTEDKGKIDM